MDIKRFRKENELSLAQFGKLCGIAPYSISNYENGKRFPSPEFLEKIEVATKKQVTASDILANFMKRSKTSK